MWSIAHFGSQILSLIMNDPVAAVLPVKTSGNIVNQPLITHICRSAVFSVKKSKFFRCIFPIQNSASIGVPVKIVLPADIKKPAVNLDHSRFLKAFSQVMNFVTLVGHELTDIMENLPQQIKEKRHYKKIEVQ